MLELGTGAGQATVCLAQQARRVVSVDPAGPGEAAEWARRYGVAGRVEFRAGEPGPACRGLGGRFGLAVVSARDAAGLGRELDAALPLVEAGGLVAVRHYPDPQWPDVRRVADERVRGAGCRRTGQAGFVGLFRAPEAGRG